MAGTDLARKWLKENDPERGSYENRRLFGNYMRKRMKNNRIAAYDQLLFLAAERKSQDERVAWEARHGGEYEGRSDYFRRFLTRNLGFDRPECLLVPFSTPGEVAQLNGPFGNVAASRRMCELAHGKPEPGHMARHLCGNGHLSCINPLHLEWGTAEQNKADEVLHNRQPCIWPELTESQMDEMVADPMPHNVVAVRMGIHASIIRLVRDGRPPLWNKIEE